MSPDREFRRLTIDGKFDVKRLQAIQARTMREMAKEPVPEAAPTRLEAVLIEAEATTIYISGNGPGIDAVVTALRSSVPDARVSPASREDVLRVPRGDSPPGG